MHFRLPLAIKLSQSGTIDGGTISVGAIVTFACQTGFRLNGSATIICLGNGMFSSFAFNCVPATKYQ